MLTSFCMLGFIRLAGMILSGNGVWVSGSRTVVAPNTPDFCKAVGTVQVLVVAVRRYLMSPLKKKNSLSRSRLKFLNGRMTGPPMFPPKLFQRRIGLARVAPLKAVAVRWSFR